MVGDKPVGMTSLEHARDKTGDTFDRPAESHDDKPVDPKAPRCLCGRYHGGVNEKIRCLERMVIDLRAQLAKANARWRR